MKNSVVVRDSVQRKILLELQNSYPNIPPFSSTFNLHSLLDTRLLWLFQGFSTEDT